MSITSAIIGGMGLIPGMPNLPFLFLSALIGSGAYLL
jgi:flagellar biosynthesis protein FlhA